MTDEIEEYFMNAARIQAQVHTGKPPMTSPNAELVERLRRKPLTNGTCLEAADAITRLEGQLANADQACQFLCADHGFATGHGDTVADMIREICAQIPTAKLKIARKALEDCREFVAGMTKPAVFGTHTISSYHPCQALVDKINAALTDDIST